MYPSPRCPMAKYDTFTEFLSVQKAVKTIFISPTSANVKVAKSTTENVISYNVNFAFGQLKIPCKYFKILVIGG